MKNDTRIQSVVSNTQPKEPGFQGGTRTVWVVRASFEIRRLPTEPATGSFLRMQCNKVLRHTDSLSPRLFFLFSEFF